MCSLFAYWYPATYCIVRLEIFTVYPATQNLVLPLIWFYSVHSCLRTNLGKLTFKTTLLHLKTITFSVFLHSRQAVSSTCHIFEQSLKYPLCKNLPPVNRTNLSQCFEAKQTAEMQATASYSGIVESHWEPSPSCMGDDQKCLI